MINLKNKAQVKIQQTAFMLIGLTILFALVGLFFLVIMMSGVKDSAQSLSQKNAMLLVSKLANSPEFSCGKSFGTSKSNCIDMDKIMALKSNSETYQNFWKDIKAIEIRKIHPPGDRICTQENYPECEILRIKSDEIVGEYSGTFVSLCRKERSNEKIYAKCEIGKLMVSYENE